MWLVYETASRQQHKLGLSVFHQGLAFSLLLLCVGFPFLVGRMSNRKFFLVLFLSLGCPFLLLSVFYEVLFYAALGLVLWSWLYVEAIGVRHHPRTPLLSRPLRAIQTNDARTALFYLFFCYTAFFGTGNIASISSFELSSTYRFITIFNPFIMGALLLLKILLPFVLVSVAFRMVNKKAGVSEEGCFCMVLAFADVLSLNFFFLVRDQGSWKDIGTSISHFAIANLFILFQLFLFAITQPLLRRRKVKQ
jgi:phosphatidylinositol glycan class N